jgi:hypothetical protein
VSEPENEKKLLERLLVDDKSILQRLVNQAEGIVGVDRENGEVVVLAPHSSLTDREQLFLLLLGRFFSFKLGKAKSDSTSLDNLAKTSGLSDKAASARISELKRERFVENTKKGEYRIMYANAESMLSGIRTKLKG